MLTGQRLLADGYGLEAERDCRTAVSCTPAAVGAGPARRSFAHGATFHQLTAALQRQGIKPPTNKRYWAMQARIRGYVTNEVGWVMNQLIAVHDPRSITLEKLDFRGAGLSRRMNRLITRAGRAAVKRKLFGRHRGPRHHLA